MNRITFVVPAETWGSVRFCVSFCKFSLSLNCGHQNVNKGKIKTRPYITVRAYYTEISE